jgi:hypothetical protein
MGAVAWPSALPPPPAFAVDPVAYVSITLSRVAPALPDRQDDVVLRGRIKNISDSSLSNLQVIPWRSFDPLQTVEAVEQAIDSPADQPLGYRVLRMFENTPSDDDLTLAPGESAPFQLRVPMAAFAFPAIDAAYLIGVHVRGRVNPAAAHQTLGRSRTFLPVIQDAEEKPPSVRLTPLVVLSSRPSLLRAGLFADTHLADEVAEAGRLRRLLDAAGQPGRSFAVDPALIDELRDMRSGYQVRTPDGNIQGQGQADADAWLKDFSQLVDEGDGYRLLYGSPDVTALVHDRQRALLAEADEAGRAVTGVAHLPLLALPAGGRADAAAATAMADLNPAALVLTRSTTQVREPLLTGPAGVALVNVGLSLSAGGPGPVPRDEPVQIRQRLLAESWVLGQADSPAKEVQQVVLVDSAEEATLVQSVVSAAPWITTEPLSRLLRSQPAGWPQRYRYPRSTQGRELSSAQLADVRRLRTTQTTFMQLLVNPEDIRRQARAAAAAAASSHWRNRARSHRAFLEPHQSTIDDLLADVTVVVTPKVVTSARRGLFPVTVRNQLPARPEDPEYNAVHARLVFTSANGQRLNVTPVEALNVRAQESFTTNASVEARSNGTVRVVAQLYTVEGRAVGRAMPIDVNATQAGTIGWLIAIGAGVVLIGTTTWRIRQVARERSQGEGDGPRPLDVSRPAEQIDV